MASLHDALRGSAEVLKSSLEETRGVSHPGVMGSAREQAVREVLSKYLPQRFQVMTGLIENTKGYQSRQQDIIILDSQNTVPFLLRGSEGTFPIETVRGTVEVKSNARRATLDEAIKNVASAKTAAEPKAGWVPFGGIVCVGGDGKSETIGTNFLELCHSLDARERCDALVVVGKCVLFWGDAPDKSPRISNPMSTGNLILIDSEEYALLFFLLSMFDHLNHQVPPALSLFSYVNGANIGFKYRTLQP